MGDNMKIEVSAKTIEKAIEEGLKKLETTIDKVDIKVLSEGGVFKKAKIEINYADAEDKDDIPEVEPKILKESLKPTPAEFEPEIIIDSDININPRKAKNLLSDLTKISPFISNVDISDEEREKKTFELQTKTMGHAKAWLDGLIYSYNINATAVVELKDNQIYATISGENLGVLIGYRGETMESIQYLLNTHLFNKLNGAKRVFLDVGGYRAKRTNDLRELAKNIGEKVAENKRSYKLEPMNSFERRIIHEELSKIENITTHSQGKEPQRYLVIEYNEN